MEREELIEFLRENLSVDVSTDVHYESGGQYLHTRVSISLEDEFISESDDTVWVGE